jgi:hypothetical protein
MIKITVKQHPVRLDAATTGYVRASLMNAVTQGLRSAALRGQSLIVRDNMAKAANTGHMARSWFLKTHPRGVTLYNATTYAAVIDRGRRPGTMPPIEPLVLWVRRKLRTKLMAEYAAMKAKSGRVAPRADWLQKKERAVAFAVARKIKAVGIQPRNIIAGNVPKLRAYVRAEVRAEVAAWNAHLQGKLR